MLRAAGLLAMDRDAEARRWALEAAGIGDPGTRFAMARFLGELGAWRDALEILRAEPPTAERGARVDWLRAHGVAARRVGRYGEARDTLDAALSIAPAPADRSLVEERRRVDQIVTRFTVVPTIARRPPGHGTETHAGRILHLVELSPRSGQSGYTIRTQQVARAQQGRGLEPHVLAVEPPPASDADGAMDADIAGVPYHWFAGASGTRAVSEISVAESAERAASIVDRLRPAALHPATPATVGNLGLSLARWSGLPMVYEVRGFREEFWLLSHEETPDVDHYVLTRQADTTCMLQATAVVTLGEAMRSEIVSRGIDPERVAVIPNAVDAETFRLGDRDPELAASFGIGADEVVVGYISSFQPYEDFASIVDAIAALRARGRPVRGLLVGDGTTRPAIARQVSRLGLEGTIAMPGRVPHGEVPRYHQLIDVFVVARRPGRVASLVTPLKPLEAMASGRAVVASRLPALMEIVTESETGLSFGPEDAVELADVLDRLVADGVERRRLGAAARAWVERERTLERTGVAYRALYERMGVPLDPSAP